MRVPLRTVILVRWNSPDILEIRVQRNESRKRVEEWLDKAWEFLRPAFSRDQFRPWVLDKALKRIVLESENHSKLYEFRDARVLDEENDVMARYETISDQGNLLKSQNTVDSIKKYVLSGGILKGLAVTWLSDKTALEDELRVLVAANHQNELLIPAHCTAGDVDHVTDQLRRFSK